jgi:hypothetical protein
MPNEPKRLESYKLEELRRSTPLSEGSFIWGAHLVPHQEGVVDLTTGSLFKDEADLKRYQHESSLEAKRAERKFYKEHPERVLPKASRSFPVKELRAKIYLSKSTTASKFEEAVDIASSANNGFISYNPRLGEIIVKLPNKDAVLGALKQAGFKPTKVREVYSRW